MGERTGSRVLQWVWSHVLRRSGNSVLVPAGWLTAERRWTGSAGLPEPGPRDRHKPGGLVTTYLSPPNWGLESGMWRTMLVTSACSLFTQFGIILPPPLVPHLVLAMVGRTGGS
ncbi:hypothetical protein CLIM01_10659 [Colletotrichum limetticola]|uniref:Uncharacterized protein n=1 Tax=Colletotrichum limetticola TaxID=1209924 RepID=A0ABQ9PIW1_9PEZI|nr:hypothetical protein CLIM01_10659 [Colletotrichum limetticola]